MIYCIVHGVTAGAYRGLLVVVAIDVMGMEKFVLGYGVQLLSMGSAMIIGPIVTGFLELSDSFLKSFLFFNKILYLLKRIFSGEIF